MSVKVQEGYYRGVTFNAKVNQDTALSNTSIQAAPGAGYSNYITEIFVRQGASSKALSILDGSGGTALLEIEQAASTTQVYNFQTPIKFTANTAICGTMADGSTGFFLAVNGFKAAD